MFDFFSILSENLDIQSSSMFMAVAVHFLTDCCNSIDVAPSSKVIIFRFNVLQ